MTGYPIILLGGPKKDLVGVPTNTYAWEGK